MNFDEHGTTSPFVFLLNLFSVAASVFIWDATLSLRSHIPLGVSLPSYHRSHFGSSGQVSKETALQ